MKEVFLLFQQHGNKIVIQYVRYIFIIKHNLFIEINIKMLKSLTKDISKIFLELMWWLFAIHVKKLLQ